MSFIHDDFLLYSDAARRLYHEYAAHEPILDYHCHLPPEDVAGNRPFQNLTEIWLLGDHYKWRAMRANAIDESRITGDAEPYDKFLAWAETVPHTLRNPLYHWTHLELKRYFDIDTLLDANSAPEIWEETQQQLKGPALSPHGILEHFDVRAVCTTDDPADDLLHHRAIAKSPLTTYVLPAFRPDKALLVRQPVQLNAWLKRLGEVAGMQVGNLSDLLQALRQRHDDFHALGARVSDHGLEVCLGCDCDEQTAAAIFAKAIAGQPASREEFELYGSFLMRFFGKLDAEKNWTKQIHLGALRNNNSKRLSELGPDTGFDSIGDFSQGRAMSDMFNRMEQADALPKTIIYNINPADNYLVASMIGNFQGNVPGKIQMGSGWWFLDQKEAMEWQINSLSNLGLLSRFVGMLTDSRSFMSYPRHEYFRRVLCNLLGQDLERGELPADEALIGDLVRRICYQNAQDYLNLPIGD